MRFILVGNLKAGMSLATDLTDHQGRTIIGAGAVLTEHYIEKIIKFGISGVYITDEISEDISIEPVISPELRNAGMSSIANQDYEGCAQVAKDIVQEIISKKNLSLDMADMRSFDNYTYAHSVNVGILSCVIGMEVKLPEEELENLVLAGLLHDMGKMDIPREIVHKPGRLTSEEYAVMQKHPELSYFKLINKPDIPGSVKMAVLLHHENMDGSGYPNGISGNEIPLYARILHVADVYDGLTSTKVYQKGYSPNEAVEYLMGAGGIMFDPEIVMKFKDVIPLYPKGSEICLSNGVVGIVIENSREHNLRPIIRVVENGEKIDLLDRKNANLTISSWEGLGGELLEKNEHERDVMIHQKKKQRILIVDDMVANLQMLRSVLKEEYEIVLAKTGQQALFYIKSNKAPDLILMDIDMPEMNGIETAKEIRRVYDKIPIMFVTSVTEKSIVLACKDLHAAGYIVRPYQPAFIKSEIERVLYGWRV